MKLRPNSTVLIISQVYVPDPASVGQHMADVAAEMVRRGHRVIVYAARAGYENPSVKYPARQTIDGAHIMRFPLASFGKSSVAMRLIGGMLFLIQCMIRGLFVRDLGGVIVSTSPPMCSMAGIFFSYLRRARIDFWVMDLNPDQMIALGKLTERSWPARMFNFLNRAILRRADRVVVLDRFMADRVNAKVDVRQKMTILPPWAHEDHLEVIDHEQNPFRREHALAGKTVIMYSGNHSTSSPVTTVLQAALKLRDRDDIVFMFIGGGQGKQEVDQAIAEHSPRNIRSLPYQPLSEIKYSLSAADVHLVTVGTSVVGIVHPCKVYGAMALARSILLLGPETCHVSDIIAQNNIGWHIQHGDVDAAVNIIEQIAAMPKEQLTQMGAMAATVMREKFAPAKLLAATCDAFEE